MFQFGILGSLDLEITMISMYIVLIFIIVFNFLTGVLEFCLEDKPLYNRMMQHMYKELMQMGLISFIIQLYESIHSNQEAETWLISIDFAHILFFFMALFFVLHAFYLMGTSISASKAYVKMNSYLETRLIGKLETKSFFNSFIFWLPYFSFSSLRDKVEFKLFHALFRDTYYRLPLEFNFPLYLSKCIEKYALKTIEVGIFSWAAVAVLLAANFIRVRMKGPFSCTRNTEWRKLLMLSLGESSVEHEGVSHSCSRMYMKLFSYCAVLLCIYIILILFFASMYKQRLIRRLGVYKTDEYVDFLRYSIRSKVDETVGSDEADRLTAAELRAVIEEFLDVKEHNNDEKLYRDCVNIVSRGFRIVKETLLRGYLLLKNKCCTRRPLSTSAALSGSAILAMRLQNAPEAVDEKSSPARHASVSGTASDPSPAFVHTHRSTILKKSKLNQFSKKLETVHSLSSDIATSSETAASLTAVSDPLISDELGCKAGQSVTLVEGFDLPTSESWQSKAAPPALLPSALLEEDVSSDESDNEVRAATSVKPSGGNTTQWAAPSPTGGADKVRKVSWSQAQNRSTDEDDSKSRKQSISSQNSKQFINGRRGSAESGALAGEVRPRVSNGSGDAQASPKDPRAVKRGSVIDISPEAVMAAKLSIHRKMAPVVAAHSNAHVGRFLRRDRVENASTPTSNPASTILQIKLQQQVQLHNQQQSFQPSSVPPNYSRKQSLQSVQSLVSESSEDDYYDHSDGGRPRLSSDSPKETPPGSKRTSGKDLSRSHAVIVMDADTSNGVNVRGRRKSVLGSATRILNEEEAAVERVIEAATVAAAMAAGSMNSDNRRNLDTLPSTVTPAARTDAKTVAGRYLQTEKVQARLLSRSRSSRLITKGSCCNNSIVDVMMSVQSDLSEDFSDIFLFSSPKLFFRSAEIAIMLNCLYMGLWSTNFIHIVNSSSNHPVVWQTLMVVPIVISIWCIGQTARACSLIQAITDVDSNLELICEVIVDMEDQAVLIVELREKILSKIDGFDDKKQIFKEIFQEIDLDNSNSINNFEFRDFLRLLELKYSDARFSRLFRALDRDGANCLSLEDLMTVLFPDEDEQ